MRRGTRRGVGVLAAAAAIVGSTPVRAQLDPLRFLKQVPPNVIVVVDTSPSMLEDGRGNFYDPHTYRVADDPQAASSLQVDARRTRQYRRVYHDLSYERRLAPDARYTATGITVVSDHDPAFHDFWSDTRLEIVKRGVQQAVIENAGIGERWALVGLRQQHPAWRSAPDCDKPVRTIGNSRLSSGRDANPCDAGARNRYALYPPRVDAPNHSLRSGSGVRLPFGTTDADAVATLLGRPVNDPLGLIPAGRDDRQHDDRPLSLALEDALSEARAAFTADRADRIDCRNTVVVLVTAGPDSGDRDYQRAHDLRQTARRFAAVAGPGGTRRVPIYVAAVRPESGESQLKRATRESGGVYFNVSSAGEVARVINTAVQAAHARTTDYNLGVPSEYQTTSPVVGTVDLTNARGARGRLRGSRIGSRRGVEIAQRGNLMVTAGFELDGSSPLGMQGVVRAFRTFRPVRDRSRPTGYGFVSDGTPLWPNVDRRRETAGRARVPKDPNQRNVFTYVPGAGTVAFTVANAPALDPHLGGADAEVLIPFVRSLPLGPIIGSTPAIMDPPSQQPPPDTDYGRPGVPGTYAGDYEHRRSIIWVGGNHGMIHAIDARTGFEVWAFIPYNLLPKLQTLLDGQPVDRFDYFVDSSPKLADVKLDGRWRTVLVIGQAYGGTFYQAFDVTEAGMGGPPPHSDNHGAVIASFADRDRVAFLWSYPRYSQFDPTILETFDVTDGYPGGRVRFFGDLRPSASLAEKSVGFTWSSPALGPLDPDRTRTVAVVGSGYFPPVEAQLPGRGRNAPAAGRSLYLIDLASGSLIGGATSCGGNGAVGCIDVGDQAGDDRRNAIQADPSVSGAFDDAVTVSKAYVGDVDGTFRRFDLTPTGTMTHTTLQDTRQPIYSSAAVSWSGSSHYLFFSTGSHALPARAGGGSDIFRLYGLRDNAPAGGASVTFSLPLDAEGELVERPTASPAVAGDVVFFATVVDDARLVCAEPTSRLYGVTYLGGAAYDTDSNGSLTRREDPVIATENGRATAPFIADQHLFMGTSGASGSHVQMFGDPETFNTGTGQIGLRLLSWRGID